MLPAGTFTDPLNEKLTYSATVTDASGKALTGFTVDANTGTLSGRCPITLQTLGIKLTAMNTDGFIASGSFSATIKAQAPTVQAVTGDLTIYDGRSFSADISKAFLDPQGAPLTFTAYEIFGPNATSWLHFDSKTGILSGTAPATGSNALAIRVTATDSYGLSAMETFGVSYAPAGNAAPTHATWSNSTTTSEMILLKAT
jgi:hypothetical protein